MKCKTTSLSDKPTNASSATWQRTEYEKARSFLYWKKKCYYYLHCSNIIWYLYQYESILSSSCTSSWQILWITATMGFLIKFVSILILLWVCDFMEELLFCLKVFEVLSMKILSSKSEYLMIFLILLKLTGITSISNLWNQRCRYLSQILIRKQKRWACKNVTLFSCFCYVATIY